jgi:ABC-type antimicrobial peptide transport system permease subunit
MDFFVILFDDVALQDLQGPAVLLGLGASDRHILIKHILPNVVSPIVLLATLNMAGAILSLAGLGFLSLGAQPPTAEWGSMLSDSQGLIFSAPYLIFIPGIAIMITVLAFNLLGDGLRDAIDSKSGGMATRCEGNAILPNSTQILFSQANLF